MKTPAPTRVYWIIWASLLGLLGLTFGAARLNLGQFNSVVALTISVAKTVLILLFFMHLRESKRITWVYVAAGLFWLGLLVALTLSDYWTRNLAAVSK